MAAKTEARKRTSRVTTLADGSCHVELTKGMVAIIDGRDIALVARYKWHVVKGNGTCYARTSVKYEDRFVELAMHRLVAGLEFGDIQSVDHINGNGLDNRRCNLRLACPIIQASNKRQYNSNSSGTPGVHLRPNGQWQARISIAGKRVSLGHFDDFNSAVKCRNAVKSAIDRVMARLAPSLDSQVDVMP